MKRILLNYSMIIVAWCAMFATVPGKAAPVGNAFTYQGALNTAAGPATGLFDFQFTLWNAASGPAQLGSPIAISATPVTNGLFNAVLDFGPGLFTGEARWLQIEVRTNGGPAYIPLNPRQPLHPTPNALFSTLAGNAATANSALTAGTAATATSATTANAVAPNAVTAAGIASGQVVKSLDGLKDDVVLNAGTNVTISTNLVANSLTLSAGPWTPNNTTNTYFTGGRVGIGVTPFISTLNVVDADGISGSIHVGNLSANGNPKLIHFGDMAGTNAFVYLGENGSDDTMELRAARFYFKDGTVGIGTNDPKASLHVVGTVKADTYYGSGEGLTSVNAATLNAQPQAFYQNAGNLTAGTLSDARLSANVALLNNSQTFTGQKIFSQPVGIGGAPFAAMLDVEGDIRLNMHDLILREGADIYQGLGWYGATKLYGGMNVDGPVLYGCDGGGLGTLCNTNLALRWRSTGNVAIDPFNANAGALLPGLTFGDNSGEGIASRRTAGANQNGLDFYTSFQARMSIDNSGRVGIGTKTPQSTLQVQGTMQVGNGHTFNPAAQYWTIAGGTGNTNTGDYSAIGGGQQNTAGLKSFVGGGWRNSADNEGAVAGGEYNLASGAGGTFIGGGAYNYVGGWQSAIAGGTYNNVGGSEAFVGGGTHNFATAERSLVSGGGFNSATGICAVVVGGGGNSSNLGYGNVAGGAYSTVAGGRANTASGDSSITLGGYANTASGSFSLAAGNRARAVRNGLFVWADSNSFEFEPWDMSAGGYANSFNVRATGGIYFVTGIDGTTGYQTSGPICASGSGSFTSYSDRNGKENFESVDTLEVLERVAAMPIETWNYKAQASSIRHMGPMAQDFMASFHVGDTEKGITGVDADGVALAAIQGLNKKVEEEAQDKDSRIKTLESKVAELQALVEKLARNGALK